MEKYITINEGKTSIRCKAYFDDWKTPQAVVLYGHGFSGHKDNRAAERFAKRLLEKNKHAVILCFDWPCHGDDVRKKLRLDDCSAYLRLLTAYCTERWPQARLLGCATSFGGYLFLRCVQTEGNPFEKLGLRCPATNMYEVLTRTIMSEDALAAIKRGKPVSVGFDRKVEVDAEFLQELAQADITKADFLDAADDLLIVHGTKDEIVPFADVQRFAENNCIELIPVEGADHRFLDPQKMEAAITSMLSFLGFR